MRSLPPLVLALLCACSSSTDPASSGGGGDGGGAGLTSGAGGAPATGGSGGSGGLSTCPAQLDLGVRFVGRTDGCKANGVRYAWSGSGFVARFKGTGVSVRLDDAPNRHTVLIDGELMPTLVTAAGEALYPLASDLADDEHVLEVYRRTEASFGDTLVLGVEPEVADGNPGELLEPPAPPARRIELIGDSISCGYGNEGKAPCAFGPDTENHYLAFGAVLARSLDAELHTIAWSGKGVIYNYNGDKLLPMTRLYERTLPNDATNLWDFSWPPELVVINLGTNDFSTGNSPTNELFTATYLALLERIRASYPEAFVLCTVGPLLADAPLNRVRGNISAAVAARVAAGDTKVKAYEMRTGNPSPGCDAHPSVATHAAMAAELETEIRAELGW